MASVRHIYKNLPAVFLQFESFWMRCEFDRSDAFAVGRVDYPDSAAAKADVDLFRSAVVTHVVRVILKVYFTDKLPGFGIIDIA